MSWRIDEDIRLASTLPGSFYSDSSAYDLSKGNIFVNSWQLVADTADLKIPGAVLPVTLLEGSLDEPLLLTRGHDDQIRCLSNVCTHRGNIICEGRGVEKSLRCRYHGRRFGLDGKFTFMPEFEGVEGFPSAKDDLPIIPADSWGPWCFTSLNPQVAFGEWISQVTEVVPWFPLNDLRYLPERARTYNVRANWALYVENYLEGFHIPYVHPGLNEAIDYGSYKTVLGRHGNLQVGEAAEGEVAFDMPSSAPDFGKRVAAYYFWLFPNLMLNFYPWGVSVNIVEPLAVDRTRVRFLPFVSKPELLGHGAGADIDRVEREDEVIVEMVQKGTRSRLYDRGRYSPKRELGVHQFHRMLAAHLSDPS